MTDTATIPPRIERIAEEAEAGSLRGTLLGIGRYLRRNPQLIAGLILLLGLIAFTTFGRLFVDVAQARPLSGPASQPPSAAFPLGTDPQGRNVLAVMVEGAYLTIRTGVVAGLIGIVFGSAVGFVAGYYGGWVDRIITWIVDVLLTVPAILFLVIISAMLQTSLTSFGMALIIALLAWRRPARQVRSRDPGDARGGLRRDGQALRLQRLLDHLPRDRPEPDALPDLVVHRRRGRRDPRQRRAGGDGPRAAERADARDDRLLDHAVLGVPARAAGGGSCRPS